VARGCSVWPAGCNLFEFGRAIRCAALAALPDAPVAAIFSCSVGAMKPDAAMYHEVTRQLDIPACDILFIGDSLEKDVADPARCGMMSCYVDDAQSSLTLLRGLASGCI
jgi:FMN phosphatase YigB (HAD superfamily)